MRKPRKNAFYIAFVLIAAAVAVTFEYAARAPVEVVESPRSAVEQAFERQASRVWLEASGTVQRVLADDRDGSPHQRFILQLDSGHTVLIAHNLDLAPRVPLAQGDALRVRGRYEWNARGGVIHWTHDDPAGREAGGWIDYQGKRYR